MTNNSALQLIEIKKNFFQASQKIEVVKGANLEIKKGELVALVGPSGSGKTTLLQIAGLLDNPSSGQVLINGINASNTADETRTNIRKNHIGFIYQFHHLLPEFSVIENVAMPLLIQGKSKKESFAEAEKILHEVDLSSHLNYKPAELSGGQQQRVAIARAAVTKPSLILADEPTGNLDADLSKKIFTVLQNLVKNYDIGCLVVTHNLELSAKSDRVISISGGICTPAELKARQATLIP